jgi:extradiol dioxygenase family protein
MNPLFHLAFPVHDLELARRFYVEVLQCRIGRASDHWVDFDFFGHQITAHLSAEETAAERVNAVDGDQVPVRHFGVILPWELWHTTAERLKGHVSFLIEPHIRFRGQVGEQATMFFCDPSGNAIELKSFQDPRQIFAAR